LQDGMTDAATCAQYGVGPTEVYGFISWLEVAMSSLTPSA
jgi:hypothetical protein